MDERKRVNLPDKNLDRDPITLAEMQRATQERVYEISREFTQGFKFLSGYPQSVTFFGSARFTEENPYYKKARALAVRIVKELDYSIVTGGGPGIMEAASRGAQESGGNSVGLTIRLPREQVMNNYLTSHVDFYYFFSRKVCLAFSSELVTLLQTRKIPRVPVILVGSEYWNEIKDFLVKSLRARGTIDNDDLELFSIIDDDDEIIRTIRTSPVREYLPYNGLKVNPIE